MTENKQFTFDRDTVAPNIKTPIVFKGGERLSLGEVLDKLNELSEDNALLHKMNAETIDFMYDNFDLSIVFTDRDLNNICNEMGWELSEKGIKIHQLEKENEQLKQQIEHQEEVIVESIGKLMDLPSANAFLMRQWIDVLDEMRDDFTKRLKELEE